MIETLFKKRMKGFKPYHPTKRMTYEDGLMLISAERLYKVTNDEEYLNFILSYLDEWIDDEGGITCYKLEDYNIDNILAGNVLFLAYEKTKNEKYLKTMSILRKQLTYQPRTTYGNFWHKRIYPYQVWLDGLYMGQIYYLTYAFKHNDKKAVKDSLTQFKNVRKYLFNEEDKLYYHAHDETKIMQWANKETGLSPHVWSRSVGWYAMALIDAIDVLEKNNHSSKELKGYLAELVDNLLPHLHENMLYQLVDLHNLEGNYLETSGSAMLAYTLIKGYKLRVFEEKYLQKGKDILLSIDKHYKKGDDIYGICRVAGLDNDKRDGSIEYYLSEEVVKNDIKGMGPYFLSHIELLRL